jgi:hypothetical protein
VHAVSGYDERRATGTGVGSPHAPGSGAADVAADGGGSPAPGEDGDVVQAVAAFVDDLVDAVAPERAD